MFGAESDFKVCSFEDVCDVCGFSAYVCEVGPSLDGVVGCGFVRVGGRGFVWFYWEGVIVEDVMYYHMAKFYDDGINQFVHRYDKCLNLNDDYVEK